MSLNFEAQPKTTTTGPENPLKEFTSEEKDQLAQATKTSEAAWTAWKNAKDAGRPKEEVADLQDKAEQAQDIEKSMQDLCD